MLTQPIVSLLLTTFLAATGFHANAAIITYVGEITETEIATSEVGNWRTAGTAKTWDIDEDDIYGSSIGAVHWAQGGTGTDAPASGKLGWNFTNYGTPHTGTDFVSIDRLTGASGDGPAGVVESGLTFFFTGAAQDFAGKTIRIGVMADLLPFGERSGDRAKAFHLRQTIGGSGDGGILRLRGGGAGDGVADMYFWDLTGVKSGDQFRIDALMHVGGQSFNYGYLGPVTFDVVPEPGAAFLVASGVLILASRRRRR